MTDNLHAVQTIFLFLLLVVVVFAALAERVKIPPSIMLVLAGLGISFIPHVPRIALNPDLVFLIFLPPLLYAAAWQTNWREFQRNLVSLTMLAIGLVGFTVMGVAFLADRFITTLDFKSGFILGAVVATTDAIAATSIAKAVGLPQRIVDLLEGESLLNDATGLLALEFGLSLLLRDQVPTVASGLLRLAWLIAAGLGVGLAIGFVMARLEKLVDDGPLEMVLSIIVPYAAYLAANEVKASGVLAVIACGMYLSRRSVDFFTPSVRIQVWGAWGALDFMLNGIVFVLIGLQLPYVLNGIRGYSRWTLIGYGAVFSLVLILLRLIWMYPGARVAWYIRRRWLGQTQPRPCNKQIFVIGWTGMRGVLALAAAISLPETLSNGRPFQQRNLIVFLTFSVILVTLVLQGLTLPPLIRALGLAGPVGVDQEELEARREILEAAVKHLEQGAQAATEDDDLKHGYEDLLHRYQHRLEAICDVCHDSPEAERAAVERHRRVGNLLLETTRIERTTLTRLRDDGKIGDDIQRRLERELDFTEMRLSQP